MTANLQSDLERGLSGAREPALLLVEELTKSFRSKRRSEGRVIAVDKISLQIEPGELFTLLGPSGCGKTTTLRSIAGLEMPDEGEITVGERTLFSSARRVRVPSAKRGLGMVFQSYAVWPHMNVFENVAFPLRVMSSGGRPNKSEISSRVERILEVVKLSELAGRPATDLSGGQQQRLALARAIIMEPPVLLLDEPLSNLDAMLRQEMVFELKRLQRELRITSVYVTHDQIEALAMSNRIAVMRDGRIEQVGKPREIYTNPNSRFVAEFIGTSNFVPGKIVGKLSDGRSNVETSCGTIAAQSNVRADIGDRVIVSIRPEHIELTSATEVSQSDRSWIGTVSTRTFLGNAVEHLVTVGAQEFRVRTEGEASIPSGTSVILRVDGNKATILPDGSA